MKYKIIGITTVIFVVFFANEESTAKNNVDENTIKMGIIYQKIQQAQYMKKICDYFYKDKHELNLIYSDSNINVFEDYIPSKHNALLNAYSDKNQFKMFIEGLSTQQREEMESTCNIEYPKALQDIKSNSVEWIDLVKEDMKKASEEFDKHDAMKN